MSDLIQAHNFFLNGDFDHAINQYRLVLKDYKNKPCAIHVCHDMAEASIREFRLDLALEAIEKLETLKANPSLFADKKLYCLVFLGRFHDAFKYSPKIEMDCSFEYNKSLFGLRMEAARFQAIIKNLEECLQLENYSRGEALCDVLTNLNFKGPQLLFYKFECLLESRGLKPALNYDKLHALHKQSMPDDQFLTDLDFTIAVYKYHVYCSLNLEEIEKLQEKIKNSPLTLNMRLNKLVKFTIPKMEQIININNRISNENIVNRRIPALKEMINLCNLISNKPLEMDFRIKLASTYIDNGSYSEALQTLNPPIDPDWLEAQRLCCRCYEKQDQLEKCRKEASSLFARSKETRDLNYLNSIEAKMKKKMGQRKNNPTQGPSAGYRSEARSIPYPIKNLHLNGEMKKVVEYCEILGIAPFCDKKEAKLKYKSLALALHPDKNPEIGASQKFQKIQNAYSYIKDLENYEHLCKVYQNMITR